MPMGLAQKSANSEVSESATTEIGEETSPQAIWLYCIDAGMLIVMKAALPTVT